MIKTHFKLFKPSLKITFIFKEFDLYEVSFLESKNVYVVFKLVFGVNNLNACDHLIFELVKLGIFLQTTEPQKSLRFHLENNFIFPACIFVKFREKIFYDI